MILKRKRQQTLAEVLKPIQRNVDNNAVTNLANIRTDIENIRAAVEWLNNNKGLIARPPHSRLSDLSDEGLTRFADDIMFASGSLLREADLRDGHYNDQRQQDRPDLTRS